MAYTLELPLPHSATHAHAADKDDKLDARVCEPPVRGKIFTDGIKQAKVLVGGFLRQPQREDVEGRMSEEVVV